MPASNDLDLICTIRIELVDSEPLIWREVEAPTSITLDDLHEIIQITIGWESEHLWEFTVGKQSYGPDGDFDPWFAMETNAGEVLLSEILRPRRTTFRYLYDFGDSWEHKVIVTKIRAPEPGIAYPRFAGGERNGPPEDCGGLYGYYEGLAATPESDDAAEEPDEWDGVHGWAAGFDPNYVDVKGIEGALREMADRLKVRKRPRRKKSTTRHADTLGFRDDAATADAIRLMVKALQLASATLPAKPRSANRK
jgi:hypothetical protein